MRMNSDVGTCMDHTGLDQLTGHEVNVVRHLGQRKPERGLDQLFKPETDFEVLKPLPAADRQDLIGSNCDDDTAP